MNNNEAEKESAKLVKARIETLRTAAIVREQARKSPSNKAREHLRKLTAERDALHNELGKRLSEKAKEIQAKSPHTTLATAYIVAQKSLEIR